MSERQATSRAVIERQAGPRQWRKAGANSADPASARRGGGFDCGTYARQREAVKETRKGDVFGLATRASAPFPLGREAQTIAALQKRVGASR